ncbi:hypothetical protein BR93DRAFT_967612 [Coniochaeta sp. PMI_546]|nr:hypothetical protein BR93DRAFT_967612 [Coniochaeta sp. PMI_546]
MHSFQTYHVNPPEPGPLQRLKERVRATELFRKGWRKTLVNRRNKDRLYVALYRGPDPNHVFAGWQRDPDHIGPAEEPDERKYTWCFLVGPKQEPRYYAVPGTRLEVAQDCWHGRWIMQRHYEINLKNTGTDMLVRMLVAKIVDKQKMYNVLYGVPVHEDSETYRNKSWLFEALTALRDSEGVVSESSRLDWMEVRDVILSFVNKMSGQGRFEGHQDMNLAKPAFDLLEGRYIWE